MKRLILAITLLIIVSCQDSNSNSLDNLNFGQTDTGPIDTNDPAAVRFQDALGVLNSKCVNCHTGYHASWTSYQIEQDWIDGISNGFDLVIPGDTNNSSLVTRLQVWGSIGTTMPQGEPALSNNEFTYIDDWIRNLD